MDKDLFFTFYTKANKDADGQPASKADTDATAKISSPQEEEKEKIDQAQTTTKEASKEASDILLAKKPQPVTLDQLTQAKDKNNSSPGTEKTKDKVLTIAAQKPPTSLKTLMLGCSLFALIVIGGASAILYSMYVDPNQTRTIIPRETGQALLITFTSLFFATFFFTGFAILAVNALRYFSQKKKNRLTYMAGMLLGLILLTISIAAGIPVISKILQGNTKVSNNIIDPFVYLQEGKKYMYSTPKVLLIAPTKIFYKLNENTYKTKVVSTMGAADIKELRLSCGNGQELVYDITNGGFADCLYTNKNIFPVSLKIIYVDRQSGERREKIMAVGDLQIQTAIDISVSDKELSFNDNKSEIIVGEAPAKVTVNAQSIVTDFGSKENSMEWDIDEDGKFEISNNAQRTHNYLLSRLHTVSYRIPGLSPYIYTFDLRVLQPDTPICIADVVQQTESSYNFSVSFIQGQASISQYAFQLKDLERGSIADESKTNRNSISKDIDQAGLYAVKTVFVTKDGKTGSCESEDFRVGQANYTASYEVLFKTPQHDQYTILETNPSISVGSNNTIFTKEIPTTIKLTIKDIRPSQDDLTIQVLYDEQPLVSPSGNEFEVLVENAGNHIITIQLQKPGTKELQILKTFTIQALQEDIVGKLLVTPDTVGIDPFTVTFDASVTTVNDPDDEIVAFTRDFGDGDIKRNVSQGVINHTYNFNIQTQEGTYYPKVTMMTKKGHVLTTKTDNPIIVKKTLRNVRINFISHPAQQAKLKDAISFSLTADGTPKTITRTFGDERVECSGRDCMDVTHSFPTAGSYDISVTVTYQDHPDVTDSAKIIIME